MDSLDLHPNEVEELKFKLSYSGNLPYSKDETPKIRFTVIDSNDFSISFPAKSEDDGYVTVKIPPLQKFISEKRTYQGKLEIFYGNHYFNPIAVPLNFERPMEVKVENFEKKIFNLATPQIKNVAAKKASEPKPKEEINESELIEFLEIVELEPTKSLPKIANKATSHKSEIIELRIPKANKEDKSKPKLRLV